MRCSDVVKDCPKADSFSRLIFIVDKIIDWQLAGLPESMRLCVFATVFFGPDSKEFEQVRCALSANLSVTRCLIEECIELKLLPSFIDPTIFSGLLPSAAIGANTVGVFGGGKTSPHKNIVEIRKILLALYQATTGRAFEQINSGTGV